MEIAMPDNIRELGPKPADTEKITINLGYVDLGHVDLMVQEGFYSNRTDFIRTAIRNQLERHADVVKQSTARKSLDLGLRDYSREQPADDRHDRRDEQDRGRRRDPRGQRPGSGLGHHGVRLPQPALHRLDHGAG